LLGCGGKNPAGIYLDIPSFLLIVCIIAGLGVFSFGLKFLPFLIVSLKGLLLKTERSHDTATMALACAIYALSGGAFGLILEVAHWTAVNQGIVNLTYESSLSYIHLGMLKLFYGLIIACFIFLPLFFKFREQAK